MINKMVAVPYEEGDVLLLGSALNTSDSLEGIEKQAHLLSRYPTNRIYTIFNFKTPVAVCGWTLINQGVAEAWSVMGTAGRKRPVSFGRALLKLSRFVFKDMQLHRCQMAVRADYDAGVRLAEALGFQCEGRMRRYDHHQADHFLYARVS